ncbi:MULTISPECIES: LacI family DNA-binding transcriptional regulator [Lactobacillus]|uniref:LacI family transcriptional regulator n=1 Tax=Lactobacillus xujianguonis TaxID=2495899 RepID=A0A437SVQ3_9LACO|nr:MULTISPECIES: LacI family DNA-binding transcriptional regulator [Lactobacillus]RVU71001.1 LacI family transcriptional regulator [Lactobacillus xujianguonis]RVU73929.1 LacI family transcriptional regulator [Lactobacillus xujianguonis]
MATLKDIAKLAHVNESTVSRALNNSIYVHPSTKKRILEAAEKLSYNPQTLRKVIERGKTKTIGIIVPNLQYNIFMDFVQNAEKDANAIDYKIIIGISDDDAEKEADLLERMRYGLVDGILIAGTGENNHLLEDIQISGVPIVQIFRNVNKNLDSVSVNYKQSIQIAIENLRKNGAKNIGLINGYAKDQSYQEKLLAYKQITKQLHMTPVYKCLNEYPKSYNKSGYDLASELFTDCPSLDALLVANDVQSLGVMQYLKANKYKVPEKVKVVSLAGCSASSFSQTQVSATIFPIKSISMRSLSLLISRIENLEDLPVQHQALNTEFMSRMTC